MKVFSYSFFFHEQVSAWPYSTKQTVNRTNNNTRTVSMSLDFKNYWLDLHTHTHWPPGGVIQVAIKHVNTREEGFGKGHKYETSSHRCGEYQTTFSDASILEDRCKVILESHPSSSLGIGPIGLSSAEPSISPHGRTLELLELERHSGLM